MFESKTWNPIKICFSETQNNIILLILFYNLLRFVVLYWISQLRQNYSQGWEFSFLLNFCHWITLLSPKKKGWVLSHPGLRNNRQPCLSLSARTSNRENWRKFSRGNQLKPSPQNVDIWQFCVFRICHQGVRIKEVFWVINRVWRFFEENQHGF